jgi:hypothetical protein
MQRVDMSYPRAFLATTTGALVTIVLAYIGAIVLLVVRMGIPLGSEGREPTSGEYLGLLLISGCAAAIGAHIAAGIARHQRRAVVVVLATFLAGGAVWGFTRPASQWPAWWGPALAAVAAVGTWFGGVGPKFHGRGAT